MKGRCTADVLWSYRFFMAIVEKYEREFHIMGIDMSKAFDSINRRILLEELRTILGESEYRIITYLLSDTTLQVRIRGYLGKEFRTTIGTPQGDALSPALFIIYLEIA